MGFLESHHHTRKIDMATTQQAPARTQQNGGLTRPQEDSRLATQFIPFGAKDAIKLSVKIVQEMICVPSRSGKVCNETEAIKFMMFCKAKALNPFEGDCFLLGYDSEDGKTASFSLITAHQAYLKRAEVHPEFDGMDSGLIVKQKDGSVVDREGDFLLDDDFILGGWAVVHFKTRKHPMKKRVALKVFNTGKSRWKKDPAGMIVKVAESDALRSSFPTMLGPLGVPDQMMS
ncbi:MAG TPA: phage recombination protein Bet, partial [Bryobacteraceae bacterium]|nr:phage recombination protein Bet [Bryobacteraceae bacterium]